jgi:hypothetical protein
MYYWGNYSESLYTAKKAPGEESLRAHKQVLANIIEESQRRALRVPPGVYCEYGYLLIQEGRAADGAKYLDLEAQTYPESKVFVERLKMQATTGATGEKEQRQ